LDIIGPSWLRSPLGALIWLSASFHFLEVRFSALATLVFHFVEQSPVHWGITGLAAVVMGLLAALFGRKFWDTAISIWP